MSVAPWSEWNTRRILSLSSALSLLSGAAACNPRSVRYAQLESHAMSTGDGVHIICEQHWSS